MAGGPHRLPVASECAHHTDVVWGKVEDLVTQRHTKQTLMIGSEAFTWFLFSTLKAV